MAFQPERLKNPVVADEVAFSARELSVLNEIATVVSAASDIRDIYSSFTALVADVIAWDGIIVNTRADDGQNFVIRVREGEAVPGRTSGTTFPVEGSLFELVLRSWQTQHISVAEGQTAEYALKIPGLRSSILAGFRSFLGTPLLSQGEMVGAIYVQAFDPHAFTEHDRMLLERIAVFVGPAIGRFDTYELHRQDKLRAQSLLKIGHLLLGASDIGNVLEQFVAELRTVVEVDRMAIAAAQPGGQALVDRHIYGVPVPGYEAGNIIPFEALEPNGLDITSGAYIFDGIVFSDANELTSPGLCANYRAGLRSAMFAGLRSEGRLVGTMNVKSIKDAAYDKSDLEYFEQVADHVAASLERTLAHRSEIEMGRAAEARVQAEQESRRLVDITKAKERLLTSASHELRTPLTGILAFIDLLARNRDGNLDEKQLRYMSIIRRNAEELSAMVNSLIDHAARENGGLHINREKFSLAPMLQEAATDNAPMLAEQLQTVHVESPGDIEIVGDRRHLLVALGHLIDNASRYAPPKTAIHITGVIVDGNVEVSVVDQGLGIPGEFVSGIFDPFDRGANTGMAEKPGAGLGLTYVRAVATAHSGLAAYARAKEGGAKFTIRFPAVYDTTRKF
ncbi:MAG: GAF domain-containing protein [Chloroflexi bacterium]|nr:GAF domain-containing protein [Chloroflexota bacterium]